MKNLMNLLLLVILSVPAVSQIESNGITIHTTDIATGLDTPWEILWAPDNHIWFTEREGRISRLDPATKVVDHLLTIDEVHEESEAGLLGMTLHPEFTDHPYVYVVYNYLFEDEIREKVVRFTWNGVNLSDPLTLLENIPGNRTHNGSRILFGPDNMLYFSLGDVSDASNAQDLESLNGKILRMEPDGGIPDDNPFPGSLVYSYGHRNPQGLVFTPLGRLYSSEHGPQNDDELNRIQMGANYGWPEVHGYCDEPSELSYCESENVIEALAAWTPTLAVAGLDYFSNENSIWTGNLLMTALKSGKLLSLSLNGDGSQITGEETWIDDHFGRLRDLCISPEGRVFIATSNRDGRGDPGPLDDRIIELIPETINGLATQENSAILSVYFDRSASGLHIRLAADAGETAVYLINLQGQLVLSEKTTEADLVIPTGSLVNGIYVLHATTGNLVSTSLVNLVTH